MAIVGWWASDEPLHVADGYRFRSSVKTPQPIHLTTDRRLRHFYSVGSSGAGKSRLARHLLYQDIAANRGFTLIDPQDLQREVLGYVAELALGPGRPTPERLAQLGDKLVLLEPADQRFGVPGINLLQVGPGQVGYQVVDAILEVIRELWPDAHGNRMEDICRNALLLLLEHRLTVLELLPLLSDEVFRARLVGRSRNPELRLYFREHLGGLRPQEVKVWLESSRNKWNAFLANPFIRPIFGQTQSTISFRDIIDQGKWLIVNVSRDKLKESRRLLGALIVALIHQASLSREHTPPENRVFHCLCVDEFEEFYTPTFLHILEGARKYGLALSLWHQNLTQPPFDKQPGIIDTILSNVHTRVIFSVSRKDAERLAGELFFPSGAEVKFQKKWLFGLLPAEEPRLWSLSEERDHYAAELMKQRQAEAYVSFKGIGQDEPFAGVVPRVADVTPHAEKVDMLRRHVANRYYRPLAQVEREIRERWAVIEAGALPDVAPRRNYLR